MTYAATNAAAVPVVFQIAAVTSTLSSTTQRTALSATVLIDAHTIAQSGGAVTVDKATGISVVAPIEGTTVTLTDASAIRILNTTGTPTNQYGIFVENLTAGGTNVAFYSAGAASVLLGLAGTGTGRLQIAGTTSGTVTVTTAAAAGTWTMTLPTGVAGTAGFQLTDAGGDGITSWASAASRREWKAVLGPHDARSALVEILRTPVWDFRYREGAPSTGDLATLYTGPMADEAPWAMHYGASIVNPVNTLGYMILGFQAQDEIIAALKAEIADLRHRLEAGRN